MFKYSLETALQDAALYGKAPFGLDTLRSDGLECTAQDYALLHDGTHALSVSNTGTYALSAENGALRMTLLRTPAYCAHPIEGRRIMRQDRFGEHMDQGERQFGFQINASEAAARLERVNTESLLLNQPPMALSFFPQGAGEKPAAGCVLDNPVVLRISFTPPEGSLRARCGPACEWDAAQEARRVATPMRVQLPRNGIMRALYGAESVQQPLKTIAPTVVHRRSSWKRWNSNEMRNGVRGLSGRCMYNCCVCLQCARCTGGYAPPAVTGR